jgi:hypothetical protein
MNRTQRLLHEALWELTVDTVALAIAAVIWGFCTHAGKRLAQRAM